MFLGHAFNVHDRCVAAGYDNGDIKLFDLRKMALRWEHNLHNGVCLQQILLLKYLVSVQVLFFIVKKFLYQYYLRKLVFVHVKFRQLLLGT